MTLCHILRKYTNLLEIFLSEQIYETHKFACGCRERPKGAPPIAGTRPAGVLTAGTAQKLINLMGLLPGRNVVILGSGDVGLVAAKRLPIAGANVKCVLEIAGTPGRYLTSDNISYVNFLPWPGAAHVYQVP